MSSTYNKELHIRISSMDEELNKLGEINKNSTEDLKKVISIARNVGKLSYDDIAKLLNERYGIQRSRQSIHGLYRRQIEREDKLNRSINDTEVMVLDIISLYSLGYNMSEIDRIVNTDEDKVSYSYIRNVISNSANRIIELDKIHTNIILETVTSNSKIDMTVLENIKNSITYLGKPMKSKKLEELIIRAYEILIKESITNNLVSVYSLLGINAVKSIADKLGISTDISEIKRRLV